MKPKFNKLIKLGFSLSAISALCLSLLACGSKAADTKTEAAVHENTPAELSLLVPGYDTGYLKKELDQGIADFQAQNPDIKVKIISVGWDELNSKIVQLYQAQEAPDLMLAGTRSIRQFAELGALEDLSPYMSDDFKSKRVDSVLQTANINGKQYGIPMDFSSRALIYRSDLIEKAPTNWDELLSTAQAVKQAHPDMHGFAIPTDITSGADELLNFIYQNGGRMVDEQGKYTLNTPANVETLSYLKKFADAKLIPDPVSTSRSGQIDLFKNGDLAMFITGPWDQKVLDENKDKAPYGVAVLPAGKQEAETLVTDSYVMSSLSKYKEAAWKFIEFMGQEQYQRPISEAFNWFPILNAEKNDPRFQTEFMKPFAALIDKGVAEPNTPNWDAFNKSFVTAAQKALSGQASPQEALDAAQAELTK